MNNGRLCVKRVLFVSLGRREPVSKRERRRRKREMARKEFERGAG